MNEIKSLPYAQRKAEEQYKLMTRKEAAEYLRISCVWLDQQTAAGNFKTVKMGSRVFYTLAHLKEIIESGGIIK